MKTILVFILLIFSFAVKAQNLVINGDFELYDSCPHSIGNVNGYLKFAYNPHSQATTDYFNSCDIQPDPSLDFGHVGIPFNSWGVQEAKSGNAYIGLCLIDGDAEYREYIVIPLFTSLLKGETYKISLSASKPEAFAYGSNNLMIAFVNDSIPMNNITMETIDILGYKMLNDPIIENKNWHFLTKNYLAGGGEKFIVIGNFLNNDETLIVPGDFEPNFYSSLPYPGPTNNAVYYYIDDVVIEKIEVNDYFPNVITPNGDGVNDHFVSLILGYEVLEATVLNRWGNAVYNSVNEEVNWDGTWNDKLCEDGVYFYSVLLKDRNSGDILQKQGFVSLQR